MKKHILISIFLLALVFTTKAQIKSENLFYMVDTPESFDSFRKNVVSISIVCPQVFTVSKEGVLSGSVDHRVLEIAKANKIKVMPLIVNPGFSATILHSIVSNPIARKRAIGMMLLYAKQFGLDGWQFDLEGLNMADRDNFTIFFKETAEALHREKLQLSAALVHSVENVGGSTPTLIFYLKTGARDILSKNWLKRVILSPLCRTMSTAAAPHQAPLPVPIGWSG